MSAQEQDSIVDSASDGFKAFLLEHNELLARSDINTDSPDNTTFLEALYLDGVARGIDISKRIMGLK